jgi:hypothetical protein
MSQPSGNPVTNLSATWYAEPRGRGTFTILSTCLTTMILCVWTAVHLNIPDHNGGIRQTFLRKPGWLFLALIAPEIVAWNAWQQRQIAWELMDAFVETFGSGPESPPGWIRRVRDATTSYLRSSKVWFNAQRSRPATHFITAGTSFRSRTRIAIRFTIEDHSGSRVLCSYGWLCDTIPLHR